MLKETLPDVVAELFRKEGRPYMTVKHLAFLMGTDLKRELGIYSVTNSVDIKNVIEPLLGDRYVFNKIGPYIYIIVPCQPEDLILAELSPNKGKSPKAVGRVMPFSKKECAKIYRELAEQGRIRILINDDLETRIFLSDQPGALDGSALEDDDEESEIRKKFKEVFKELDNGRIFVRICDLRKKLGWPREVFDFTLKMLRDKGVIQLHVGDVSLMTPDEVKNCFVDENNFRMGTVTWHGK